MRTRLACAVAGLASLAVASSLPPALPDATALQVRLLTPVSSYRSKSGFQIAALVVSPVGQANHSTLPTGTLLRGQVGRVKKVGLGLVHEKATIELKFRELVLPDGHSYAVEARLTGVDNARERVDRRGAIHGMRATDSLSHRFGARITFAVVGHPLLMIPMLVVESGLFRFPDPEIDYRAGTELDLEVQLPESLRALPPPTADDRSASASESPGLQEAVDELPYWSYSKRQRQSMDLVNVALVGDREEVERAFTAAGWSGSRPNSMMGGLKAIRAIVEDREYTGAPMRTLLLDGQEPDLTRQKTLNTFEKRHHLRIWKRPQEAAGRSVWAVAATKDIATTFSVRPFGFTHEIEKNVDRERDKVVDDLVFTGCVDAVSNLRRPAPLNATDDHRKGVSTDSRVTVLELNSCAAPVRNLAAFPGNTPPAWWVRGARRVILTARNHFIRDNIFWRSADAARIGIQATRNWYVERRNDRRAEAARAGGEMVATPAAVR